MSLDLVDFIDKKKLSINVDKVKKHEIPIGDLELYLERANVGPNKSIYCVGFILDGADRKRYTIKRWDSEEQAKIGFERIANQIKDGAYELHVYSDGNAELKLLGLIDKISPYLKW